MATPPAEEGERTACLALDPSAESSAPAAAARRLSARRLAQGAAAVLLATAAVAAAGRGAARLRELGQEPSAARDSSGRPPFLSRQFAVNTCTEWFSEGNDCSKQNLWTCVGDDGSFAFNCCCNHGWGDFSYKNNRAAGLIKSAAHKDRCVDLTMPYTGSGTPFKDGHAMVANCNWGNPNKMFHLPLKGSGKIHWATHPKYCLGVKNGANFPGNMLSLVRCQAAPTQWTTFDMSNKGAAVPHQIRLGSSPNMCLAAGGSADGAPLQLANCNPNEMLQRFTLALPPLPPSYADSPSIFCIALMLPRSYEKGLLEDQYAHKVGIFECNEYAVYSNESIVLHSGKQSFKTNVVEGSLQVKFGGQWHSALNTDVFIRFWAKVVEDARAWKNKWTVKIDPDAVFFPSRLHEILRNRWYAGDPKAPVYLNNCHRGMHGPIEVLSQQALKVYKKRSQECKHGEPYKHKQEDFYFRRCWALLNISKVNVYNLLFENLYACDERSDTRDGRHPCFSRQVSFHPFKSVEGQHQCYRRGQAMHWASPMNINAEEPSSMNYHHA